MTQNRFRRAVLCMHGPRASHASRYLSFRSGQRHNFVACPVHFRFTHPRRCRSGGTHHVDIRPCPLRNANVLPQPARVEAVSK